MDKTAVETVKREFPGFVLYVGTGLVVFTIVRLVLPTYGFTGWRVTIIALAMMFIVLETLTQIGWLTKPFSGVEMND